MQALQAQILLGHESPILKHHLTWLPTSPPCKVEPSLNTAITSQNGHMQPEIKISMAYQSASDRLDGDGWVPSRTGKVLFAATSTPALEPAQPHCFFLFAVFTDDELEALLDRSDMLSTTSESSNTGTQTKMKEGVKIYKVIDQQCREPTLKQLGWRRCSSALYNCEFSSCTSLEVLSQEKTASCSLFSGHHIH